MTPAQNAKLTQVLQSNTTWPLVIVGMMAARAPNATVIPASIAERELHNDTMAIKPFIVIDGLDNISPDAQRKFVPLLKDRRTGMHKLPADVRIIVPVRSAEKLSKQIKDLVLIYNV